VKAFRNILLAVFTFYIVPVYVIADTGLFGGVEQSFAMPDKNSWSELELEPLSDADETEFTDGESTKFNNRDQLADLEGEQPTTFGDEEPATFGDEEPATFGDEEPATFGDEEPATFGDEEPAKIASKNLSKSNGTTGRGIASVNRSFITDQGQNLYFIREEEMESSDGIRWLCRLGWFGGLILFFPLIRWTRPKRDRRTVPKRIYRAS